MKWTPLTAALLFMKNLTGSGKWAKRYFLAQGYDIHPTVVFGGGVVLDSLNPERIHIYDGAQIGNGAMIIAHGPGKNDEVEIGFDAFIGARAIVMRSVGEGAVVGAGSVVTRPVPAGETWAGNPARRLK